MSDGTKEKIIKLPFIPWRHQIPLFEAFETNGFKRLFLVHHRRAGKDVASFNLIVREAIRKPGTYVYMLPTIDQGRKVIWNARQNNGQRFVEGYIPKELILKTHEQDMRIELVNGSVIQIAGSDNYDRLMGMNAWGLVFSEWSLSDPAAWDYLQPIIQLNGGWALFQGTPRGQNHFYDMWLKAKEYPKIWFSQMQTIKDTGLVSEQEVAESIARGEISYEKAQQEYYCSFLSLNEQTYYGRYMDEARLRGRLGNFPWDPSHPVHAAFDWGHRDQTVAIFFQLIQGTVRIIDCLAKTGEGLEFYAKYMKDKPFSYGTMIGPHDMRVHELNTNQTRWAKMHSLGYTFQVAPHVPVQDGIEACRTVLPRTYINATEGNCPDLIKALENYRAERVTVNGAAISKPKHDSYSDFCFTGDMMILTSLGEIPISEVKEGMLVKTPTGHQKILKVHVKETNMLCDLYIGKKKITCTPEHKIFSNKGLIKCDSLRYNDIIEYHSIVRSFLWKKLCGLQSKRGNIEGFKRTILSLRTKQESSLMAMFINSLVDITKPTCGEKLQVHHYTNLFGCTTTGQSLRDMLSTIKIKIERITRSITSKLSTEENTKDNTCSKMTLGDNQKKTKKFSKESDLLLQSGIQAQKDLNGIEIMQKEVCLGEEEYATKGNVYFAEKSLKVEKRDRNTVAIYAKTKIEYCKNLISKIAIVACAKLYLTVVGMLGKKHAVKSVHAYCLAEQKRVYDLSVAIDNCYYVNGYLVSNCDSFRYACLMIPHIRADSITPQQLAVMRNNAKYGGNMANPFLEPTNRYR